MELIIYSRADNTRKDILLKQISTKIQPAPMMFFDIKGLVQQLKLKVSGETILVFLISSEAELDALWENKTRFFNTRFIILLPEGHSHLLSKALALKPRYLGYTPNDYTDIGNVLKKIIKRQG